MSPSQIYDFGNINYLEILRLDLIAVFEQPNVHAKENCAEYRDKDHAENDVDIRDSQNSITHPVDHEKQGIEDGQGSEEVWEHVDGVKHATQESEGNEHKAGKGFHVVERLCPESHHHSNRGENQGHEEHEVHKHENVSHSDGNKEERDQQSKDPDDESSHYSPQSECQYHLEIGKGGSQ